MEERTELTVVEKGNAVSSSAKADKSKRSSLEGDVAPCEAQERCEAEIQAQLSLIESRLQQSLEVEEPSKAELQELARMLLENAAELVRPPTHASAERAEQLAREAELKLAHEQLARQQAERLDELRRERELLAARSEEASAETARLHQAQRALELREEEHREACEQLSRRRARIDELESRLERELEDVERRREETRAQRSRIARQLRRERAELEEDMAALDEERRRWHARRRGVQEPEAPVPDAAGAQVNEDQLRELAAALEEVQRLTAELANVEQQASAAITTLEEEIESLRAELKEQASPESSAEELVDLRMERLTLTARIRELEQSLMKAETELAEALRKSNEVDEMQQRFQMAVDDIRELKRRNAELEDEFARRGGRHGATIAKQSEGWAETKAKLIAQMEGEAGDEPAITGDERLTVEGAIRITDEVVAERDAEIARLKQELAELTNRSADAAEAERAATGGTSAPSRESVAELERQWAEKIRKEEVEISIERAKLARERMQLEEKMRMLESQADFMFKDFGSGQSERLKKPGRRWLERLGLTDRDDCD